MDNSITIPTASAGAAIARTTTSRHDFDAREMTFQKTEQVASTRISDVSPRDDDDNESIITLVADDEPETNEVDEKKKDLAIESNLVENDPRLWSDGRKRIVLASVSSTALVGIIAGNIFFPAVDSLEIDLKASQAMVALSVSLFILGQGFFPIFWTAISEVKGRKITYIFSLIIFCGASAACAVATNIQVFIGCRVVQACGSSAALALGAGSIADIYDPSERGSKLGIFYAVPLLGPSLAPLIGGAITKASDWRATFWFLLAYGAVCLVVMIFLPETWRKERSCAWQSAATASRNRSRLSHEKRMALGGDTTMAPTPAGIATPAMIEEGKEMDDQVGFAARLQKRLSEENRQHVVRITVSDANPFPVAMSIIRSRPNRFALLASAILFALQYTISFSSSQTFAKTPYLLDPLNIGLILLAFGGGNVVGSVFGGMSSDRVLRRLTEADGGVSLPQFRLQGLLTTIAMFVLPAVVIAFGWLVYAKVHIAAICIALFFIGVPSVFIYSSTLAFLVDVNPGRSSSAVALNALARGILAAIGTQVAGPAQAKLGYGWFWTGFAGLIVVGEVMILIVRRT